MLRDPQNFAEKLFKQLESCNGDFALKLLHIRVIARVIGVHKLVIYNFYPYLQRFLNPNQRDVTLVLQVNFYPVFASKTSSLGSGTCNTRFGATRSLRRNGSLHCESVYYRTQFWRSNGSWFEYCSRSCFSKSTCYWRRSASRSYSGTSSESGCKKQAYRQGILFLSSKSGQITELVSFRDNFETGMRNRDLRQVTGLETFFKG